MVDVAIPDTPPTPTPDLTPSWRDGLTGEYEPLKTDASLATFKDVGSLAKSYIATKALVGTKPVGLVPPGEKATPEEKVAYDLALRKTLGVPDAATGYKITRPDVALDGTWDTVAEGTFLAAMHKVGASPQIVQEAINVYGQMERARLEAGKAEANAVGAALRTEWGPNYDAHLGRANRALQEFGGDEVIEFLTTTGLGRHPLMVKAWAKVGDALVEHGAMRGEGLGTMSAEDAQSRVQALRDELDKLDEGHPRRADLVEEIIAVTKATGRR